MMMSVWRVRVAAKRCARGSGGEEIGLRSLLRLKSSEGVNREGSEAQTGPAPRRRWVSRVGAGGRRDTVDELGVGCVSGIISSSSSFDSPPPPRSSTRPRTK